jgi:hypothetical protein
MHRLPESIVDLEVTPVPMSMGDRRILITVGRIFVVVVLVAI